MKLILIQFDMLMQCSRDANVMVLTPLCSQPSYRLDFWSGRLECLGYVIC